MCSFVLLVDLSIHNHWNCAKAYETRLMFNNPLPLGLCASILRDASKTAQVLSDTED